MSTSAPTDSPRPRSEHQRNLALEELRALQVEVDKNTRATNNLRDTLQVGGAVVGALIIMRWLFGGKKAQPQATEYKTTNVILTKEAMELFLADERRREQEYSAQLTQQLAALPA